LTSTRFGRRSNLISDNRRIEASADQQWPALFVTQSSFAPESREMHKAAMSFAMGNNVRALAVRVICSLLLVVFAGLASAQQTVLLVSIDGFRWDYFQKTATPNLDRIAREGLKAKALIPVFPTMTFPAHYSMVTGLHPEQHGIVGNTIRDEKIGREFNLRSREVMQDTRWWGGEPIWLTAQRQGLKSATCFWPGTDVEIAGGRPTYWLPFDGSMPNEKRIAQVIDWLSLPDGKRPRLLTIYFGEVDKAGHRFGPDSKEVVQAIREADNAVGLLIWRLEEIGRADVNLIVVSDHGMAGIDPERAVVLDEYVNMDEVVIEDSGEIVLARAKEGQEETVLEQLRRVPHVKFYRKDDLPERLHFKKSERIPPIVGLPEDGWMVLTRAEMKEWEKTQLRGMHGFDNALASMHGIFLARGPAFRKGQEVEAFSGVNIYGLAAKVLGIKPAENDGEAKVIEALLERKGK
jgi:predicted AlkP superfamily pyrophosphatase or phosphodiesterase